MLPLLEPTNKVWNDSYLPPEHPTEGHRAVPENLHVFISYKKHNHETPAYATNLERTLKDKYRFEVFLDVSKLDTADQWEQRIYDEIHKSDVLILLLEPETARSEWVQREVDFARGACVSVLPLLVVDPRQLDINEAIQKLALSSVQYSKYFQQTPDDYERLAADIRRLALDTRTAQRQQQRERESHWYSTPIQFQLKQRTYQMKNNQLPDLNIHLTVGNILDMPAGTLDVLVNSENDYLQMARFYEVNTLSARLRKMGAYFNNGRLIEDTLQSELMAQCNDWPVPLTQVLVTSAGHAKSVLRAKKHLKVIFHAITVQFNIGALDEPVRAMSNDDAICDTIKNCFERVNDVNQNEEFRLSIDPKFDAIKSIAFPLFGTGMGGRTIKEIAPAMINGLYRAIVAEGPYTLRDIHLLVYSANEVTPIRDALENCFQEVI